MLALLVGCVSYSVDRNTSERYFQICGYAEHDGRLDIEVEKCYRTLINVEWGKLSEDRKSETLYNFARVERQLSKFAAAVFLLNQALDIEEAKSEVANEKIGRRLVELSMNLAAMNRWKEGALSLERVIPIAHQFTGSEKKTIISVFSIYGEQLIQLGEREKGHSFVDLVKTLDGSE